MSDTTPPAASIYFFANQEADATEADKPFVGGKGLSVAEMTRNGLKVPPGFTISAECCRTFLETDTWPEGLQQQVREAMTRLEEVSGRKFGSGDQPLLVAVRSGAAQSMPGMMETILNIGLNPDCVQAMTERLNNTRKIWEDYRDFLVSFGETVGDVREEIFREILIGYLREMDLTSEEELDADLLATLCDRFRTVYHRHTKNELPTDPYEQLFHAIETVFRSWNSTRAKQYRSRNNIDGLLGTAVTVQMMCPSEVSGVIFTAHPINPALPHMVIEASYGLGEAVVLGKVTPDRFIIHRDSGEILERNICEDHMRLRDGKTGPGESETKPALTDDQIRELVKLALRVEEHFQTPSDIEWGLHDGEFYMLQARPIRRGGRTEEEERESLRQEEIEKLQALTDPRGTVWSRFNLAEVLPEPTPMTWAIVREFMSGKGGFGQMYRDLGFDPDPELDDIGIFDLICNRPYCNLSREPKMQYKSMPFEHPFAKLKENPTLAMYPRAVFNPSLAGWKFWLFLPVTFVRVFFGMLKLNRVKANFAQLFRNETLPTFLQETKNADKEDLTKLDSSQLLDLFNHWVKRTLFDFARESLKPTALAGLTLGNLETALARLRPKGEQVSALRPQQPLVERLEQAQSRLRRLVMGVRPDKEAHLSAALRDLAQGKMDRDTFMEQFGHRGPDEMELASPRWSEDDSGLFIAKDSAESESPNGDSEVSSEAESPFAEFQLTGSQKKALDQELKTLHEFLALRETGKHHLLRGYALIRKILLELDRRYRLDGGIFYLTPEELPDLTAGKDYSETIRERRRRRELLLRLPVPQVLFSDDLQAIGSMPEEATGDSLQGVPLSAGVVEGVALVLQEPTLDIPNEEPFILVCPTTDPAWVPLFERASGVIMETGGILSHGAIVAREFGLPAVAGLPHIHHRLKSGQRLRIDGSTGKVNVLETESIDSLP